MTSLSLTELLLSDLQRYYFYNGMENRHPRKRELYKCFLIPRCMLAGWYRVSRELDTRGWTGSAKIITWMCFFLFGSEINSKTSIGSHLYFPHSNGIVIGAISIGSHAVIYHHVTIGASRVEPEMKNRPEIGDNVVIGSGAKILGKVFIPSNSLVKANMVVTAQNVSNLTKVKV